MTSPQSPLAFNDLLGCPQPEQAAHDTRSGYLYECVNCAELYESQSKQEYHHFCPRCTDDLFGF